jgi:hypothetical protein
MRDLRDPQKLGEALRAGEFRPEGWTLSEYYDRQTGIWNHDIPDYPQDESMATVTAREYRAELEARAAEGDKYAKSALESLNTTGRVEGYDDAG